MLAHLHPRMGGGGFGEGEALVHRRLPVALGQAGPDGAVNLVGERGLEVGAARAERRAGQGQAAAHYLRHVDLCLRAALERNTAVARSEEHTSELQSLMRISYAVFCLTKKNKQHAYQ